MNRKRRRAAVRQGKIRAESSPAPPRREADRARAAEVLTAGVAHHRAGRLAEAEAHYRQVLAAVPAYADALHLLGVIAYQVGRHDVAIELIGQAIQQDGWSSLYYSNRGLALQSLRRLAEAMASYDRALALAPDNAEAWNMFGSKPAERKSLALRHHDEIQVELVLHVNCCPVARNRLVERHDLDTGALRLALPFYRLVVDAYPGNARRGCTPAPCGGRP
jgi:tetratricopeptide (TPR) repeat protein